MCRTNEDCAHCRITSEVDVTCAAIQGSLPQKRGQLNLLQNLINPTSMAYFPAKRHMSHLTLK